jgi:DNA-binding HxlR family transcriptional regulator
VAAPRSILLRRVLGCLRDFPHDNTSEAIARRLGRISRDEIDAALRALESDGLVLRAGDHSQLTRRGWESAREIDPQLEVE